MPSNTDRLTHNVSLWQKFPECQIFKDLRLPRDRCSVTDAMLKAVQAVPAYLTLRHTFHRTP
jgi:hypothetical protein